jgi:hypothetical protein
MADLDLALLAAAPWWASGIGLVVMAFGAAGISMLAYVCHRDGRCEGGLDHDWQPPVPVGGWRRAWPSHRVCGRCGTEIPKGGD